MRGKYVIAGVGHTKFGRLPGRGTIVRVRMQYDTPAGKLGAMIARMFGREPAERLREGLRHFKQLMEAGEIAVAEPQLRGAR